MKTSALMMIAAVMACGLGAPAPADTIILKSGDTFSGTITNIGVETVDVTTPFAGPIHVKRDTVRTLRSEGKVLVTMPDGATHTAFIAPVAEGAGWHETTDVAPPLPVAVAAPAPAPAKVYAVDLEKYYIPIGSHWKNQFTLGLVNTTGNTDSTNFASELAFNYKEKPQEFNMKFGGVYDVTNGSQTAGQFYFDAVYRRTLPEWDKTERWYVFGENHELYDAIKGISLRSTTAAGLGYYLIKTDKLAADLRAGPAFVYERYFTGHTETDASGLVGLRIAYTLNDRASVSEDALYTVALADMDRYTLMSETALNIKLPELARGLGLKFAFRDDYDNNTTPPAKHNDTRLTLAFTLDF